jgi:hypothetical protein
MKKLIIPLSVAAMLAAAAPAHAETVSVPWGDWVASILGLGSDNLLLLVTAFLAFIVRQLPSRIVAILQTWQVEQVLARAIVAGINRTAGAAQGKALSVEIANKVVAEAVQYVVNNAPAWLVKWVGGAEGIRDKVISRITVVEGGEIR